MAMASMKPLATPRENFRARTSGQGFGSVYKPVLPAANDRSPSTPMEDQAYQDYLKSSGRVRPIRYLAPAIDSSGTADLRSRISGLDAILANPTTAPGMAEALSAIRANINAGVSNQQREIADQVARRGFGGMSGAGMPDMYGAALEGDRAFATGQADVLSKAIAEAMNNRSTLLGQLADSIANQNSLRQRSAEASAENARGWEDLRQRGQQSLMESILRRQQLAEDARQFNIGESNRSGLGFSRLDEDQYQFDTQQSAAAQALRDQLALERERAAEEQRRWDLTFRRTAPMRTGGFSGGGNSAAQPFAGSYTFARQRNPATRWYFTGNAA